MRDGFHWTNCPVSPFLFPSPSRPLPFAVSLSPVPSPSLYRPLPPLHLPLPPLHLALAICVSPSVSFPRPPSFLSISLCVNSVIYANSQRPFNTLLWSTLPLFSLPPPPFLGSGEWISFQEEKIIREAALFHHLFPQLQAHYHY